MIVSATLKAQAVIAMRPKIEQTVTQILHTQAQELDAARIGKMGLIRIELEFMDKLRRIYTLAKRIAREVLPHEIAMQRE